MRKFFLIPLVALFTCVNVWADAIATVEVGGELVASPETLTDLNSALNNAAIVPNATLATVTLLTDVEGENGDDNNVTLTIPAEKNVLLNLNGKGIVQHWQTIAPTYRWKDGITEDQQNATLAECGCSSIEEAYDANFRLYPGGPYVYPYRDLIEKVTGGDVDENALIYNLGTLKIISEGNSIIQQITTQTKGNAATICNAGHLTIEGGVFIGPITRWVELSWTVKMPVIWAINDATTIINGGTFLCSELRSDYACGANFGPIHGSGTFQINGGVFSVDEENAAYNDWVKTDPDNSALATPRTTNNPVTSELLASKLGNNNLTTINVPYTNANIPGYGVRAKDTPASDSSKPYRLAVKPVCVVVPTTDRLVVSGNAETLPSATTTKKFVYVQPGAKLTVGNEETLRVNSTSGIILGGTDAKLVVAPGATLLSEGDIITSSNDNIELTMDARANKYSTLAIKAGSIQAEHPEATVTLKSICKFEGGVYSWQRFAIPTYQENLTVADINHNGTYGVSVHCWDYAKDSWSGKLTTQNLLPFQCYNMTINDNVNADFTFECELVGNGNPTIKLYNGWNYLANSYSAEMDLAEMLTDLHEQDGNVSAAVWVQKVQGGIGEEDWASKAYVDVIFNELGDVRKLHPMQAFVCFSYGAKDNFTLDYENYVSKYLFPTGGGAGAPRRAPQAYEDITRAHIVVADANGQKDTVMLYLSNDFTDGNDNGFDVPKNLQSKKFNLYAVSPALGNLERIATNNLENTSISLQTLEAESYTMTFDKVSLAGYSIIDNVTKTVTEINPEKTYEFTAAPNQTHEGRFTVVLTEEPTAIDNVEAQQKANGIYSITGVYMGTNFNVLPAGIYVINGKKVVK